MTTFPETPMTLPSKHILLVEDDFSHGELVQHLFEKQSPHVRLSIVSTLAQARKCIAADPPSLIIADLKLPDGNGIDLISQPQQSLGIPVVVMTSIGNERQAVEAIQAGHWIIFSRPPNR